MKVTTAWHPIPPMTNDRMSSDEAERSVETCNECSQPLYLRQRAGKDSLVECYTCNWSVSIKEYSKDRDNEQKAE